MIAKGSHQVVAIVPQRPDPVDFKQLDLRPGQSDCYSEVALHCVGLKTRNFLSSAAIRRKQWKKPWILCVRLLWGVPALPFGWPSWPGLIPVGSFRVARPRTP